MVKNKMNGEERRNKIIDYIEHSPVPVSGTALANHFSVSRQAVVQDIALLRASGNDILSTNRGYVIAPKPKVFTRTFKVSHSDDQTADELSLIVDLGGKVLNVFVDHNVYGRFEAKLDITSRRDVVGVAAVPGSSFFREDIHSLVRFHFAKKDNTLNAALDNLSSLRKKCADAQNVIWR